jgi:hypothetical protein
MKLISLLTKYIYSISIMLVYYYYIPSLFPCFSSIDHSRITIICSFFHPSSVSLDFICLQFEFRPLKIIVFILLFDFDDFKYLSVKLLE